MYVNVGKCRSLGVSRFLHSFEDFYRKLGVTLVAHPRGARTPPAGRSLIRDRDRQPPGPPATPPAAGSPAPSTASSQVSLPLAKILYEIRDADG